MNASLIQSKQFNQSHDAWLIWALIASLFAHVTFAYVVPSFNKSEPEKEKPKELKVEIVKIKAPEPVITPEPPKPEPPKPKPKPKPKPIKKKVVRKPKPTPLPEPEPQPEPVVEPPPQPVEAPPPVITAAPTPEPEFVAPEPPPPPPEPAPEPEPAGPTQADINAYRNQLYAEFKRNQRYPKMAQRRGIQGDVGLLIGLDAVGNVTNVTVVKSSGSAVLDKAAIKTVKRSNIKPLMPDILKGQINQIKVTLSFKLQ